MRKFNNPDHSKLVRVGRFYVPASLDEAVLVELADGCFESLDCYETECLLENLGFKIERHGWASWERDNWRFEGDNVLFHEEKCTWCHHQVKIPKKQVAETLLLLKCPHLSKHGKIILKRCGDCLYHYKGCSYRSEFFKPMRLMSAYGFGNFVELWKWRDDVFADWGANLFFRIANERVEEELISGLHRGLHIVDSKEKISFVNYYSFYHNGRIPEEYRITIFKDKLLGEVSSTESGEVYSYEDWQNLLWDLNGKKAIVLHAFKRVCYEAKGQVDPIMHWKLLQKPMQLIFQREREN
ncbi:MAG: hypothetical protein QXR76_03335 [Candidatus Bathyarchaeia archaeon]